MGLPLQRATASLAAAPEPSEHCQATVRDAMEYINDVKARFSDNSEKFQKFLAIMRDFKHDRLGADEIADMVCETFKGHPDLILGFNRFLPPSLKITAEMIEPARAQLDQAFSYVQKIKNRFENKDHIYRDFLRVLYLYKRNAKTVEQVYREVTILFQGHRDLLEDFIEFLPRSSESIAPKAVYPHKLSSWNERCAKRLDMNHINGVKRKSTSNLHWGHGCHIDQHDPEHERERTHIKREKNWTEDGAKHLQHYSKDLDFEQDRLVPSSGIVEQSVQIEQGMGGLYAQQYKFYEKVKEKLQPEAYQEFLKCFDMYNQGTINRKRLKKLTCGILEEHSDLMDCFNEFLVLCDIVAEGSIDDAIRLEYVEKSNEHNRNEQERNCPRHGDQDQDGLEIGDSWKAAYLCSNDKLCKPIAELDLSDCERCTPSYCHLPKDFPVHRATCRGEIETEVLNDEWVAVTSGSEDYSLRQKNQYEESLFKCEDDRYELDMVIESAKSTIKRVKEILEKVQKHSVGDRRCTEDHLDQMTPLNWRCIERLYGDHGMDVADVIRKNASQALPVILTRLKQKLVEWTSCREDFKQVWAEIYAKNYQKSLDHCSFNFKQQDAKTLSRKALLAEMKEINEKQQKDNELLAIDAGTEGAIVPYMEFDYLDSEIHEDIYRIISFSCGEVCASPEQFKEVMRVWTTFLEPMLGVHSRPQVTEDIDVIGPKSHGAQQGSVDSASLSGSLKRSYTNGDDKGVLCNEASTSHSIYNVEIEEGELSPNEYIEDASNAALLRGAMCMAPKIKGRSASRQYKSRHGNIETSYGDAAAKNHVGDEESAKSPSEESGRASSASEHPISSEAGDGEQCSYEYHAEEEEDADQAAKVKGDGEAKEAASTENADQEIKLLLLPKHSLHMAKPLAKHVPEALHHEEGNCSRTFYGNASYYILFRLHQILYERLHSAKINSSASGRKCGDSKDANSPSVYAKFISGLYSLLDGSSDITKFENDCHSTVGTQSYVLFTLDKLICKIVKQLQAVASEEMDNILLHLYSYEKSRRPGVSSDHVYRENARALLRDENLYQFRFFSNPTRLSIRLMEEIPESEVTAASIGPEFSSYLNNDLLSSLPERSRNDVVVLARNKRRYEKDGDYSATSKAIEGIRVINGLERKVCCSSSKVSYVLETEDYLCHVKKKRKDSPLVAPEPLENQA